ncbi:GNAT family N-acetyltransferase [Ornithinimicrobium sufpigmenti]|uniref:GNAT family N-acetyltransferase n=1 Tax=Ornithinimicrobium sufpigmenti TaxID=2508882 RepID=UPI0010360DE8|nr:MULTISPECIES: GNAT family N-acetyltransferase [unclassified Ornithinimicrobium]
MSEHHHEHTHHHPHEGGSAAAAPGPLADASVRTARPSDAPAVGLVQATVYQAELTGVLAPELLEELTGPRFAAVWRRSLERPPSTRHRLLVACAGPQVVGYVALGPAEEEPGVDAERTGMVYDGAVHPDARGAGHGSRLLNAAVDTLRAGNDQLEAVTTWVRADAETSLAFLQAAGFAPDGAWRDRVVGEDGRTTREVRLVAEV